jgi:hypothetical protein
MEEINQLHRNSILLMFDVLSVTQEKSFDLGSVDESCGGTYGPCQKYKTLTLHNVAFCDKTYVLKRFTVLSNLLHWLCTSELVLKQHIFLSA